VKLKRPSVVESRSWFKITNHADSADLFIYGEIGWEVGANDLVMALAQLEADTITVRINSPGGDVFEGVAIYEALRSHPATVNTQIDSLAASAASFIALAGETVTISEFGQMMIHDPYTIGVGNAADLRETADLLDRQGDNIAGIYAKRAGGSVSSWRDAMRVETWYSSDEAVKAGLADQVKSAKDAKDEPLLAAKWDLSVFAHAGRENAPEPYLPAQPEPSVEPEPETWPSASLIRAAMLRARLEATKEPEPFMPTQDHADVVRRALRGVAS